MNVTSNATAIFVGNTQSVFVTRTAEELGRRGISVAIVDPYVATRWKGKGFISRVVRIAERIGRVRNALAAHPPGQAAVIHFLGPDIVWLAPMLRRRGFRVIGLAYGSDILRRNQRLDPLLSYGLRAMSEIVATNDTVINRIRHGFPKVPARLSVLCFGLPVLGAIDDLDAEGVERAASKTRIGLNPQKITVALGYNASSGQRQTELLDFFCTKVALLPHVQFVVPVQYGSAEVRDRVIETCAELNRGLGTESFVPISEFYDAPRSAMLRMATDILINHSVSDSFSGTVQEVLYAGNAVLAAAHLPYANMPGSNPGIRTYAHLEEILNELDETNIRAWLTQTQAAVSDAKASINATSSWDGVFPAWERLIMGK